MKPNHPEIYAQCDSGSEYYGVWDLLPPEQGAEVERTKYVHHDKLDGVVFVLQGLSGSTKSLLKLLQETGVLDNTWVELFPETTIRGSGQRLAYKQIDQARNELRTWLTAAKHLCGSDVA